jgi:predicted transcriptional regulator
MSNETQTLEESEADILRLSAEIVASYVAQNTLPASAVGDLIGSVHEALSGLGKTVVEREPEKRKPAVPISKSVQHDHIICLEDGKKLKMLKRHLKTAYDMTPEQYRERWGLPPEYPMVAPNYARHRSSLAKKIGLGTKPRSGRK